MREFPLETVQDGPPTGVAAPRRGLLAGQVTVARFAPVDCLPGDRAAHDEPRLGRAATFVPTPALTRALDEAPEGDEVHLHLHDPDSVNDACLEPPVARGERWGRWTGRFTVHAGERCGLGHLPNQGIQTPEHEDLTTAA